MIKRSFFAAVSAVCAASLLAACGGGGNTTTTSNTTAASGNKQTTGSHAKQLNPMHAAHNAMSGTVMNINMGAMNGSKQDGSAHLVQKGGSVVVTVQLFNEPKGASEPAHIHMGTCQKLNPAPYKPLHNVVGGKSETVVAGLTIAQLKKGQYAINAHKSAADLKTYVSCGTL